MLKDFINQAQDLQRARADEWIAQARMDALRREAKAIRRFRNAVGHKLIALGERIADPAIDDHAPLDSAA